MLHVVSLSAEVVQVILSLKMMAIPPPGLVLVVLAYDIIPGGDSRGDIRCQCLGQPCFREEEALRRLVVQKIINLHGVFAE